MNDLNISILKSYSVTSRPGHLFGQRSTNGLHSIPCRTARYQKTFYPDSVISWNNIGPVLRGAKSLSIFKKNILKIIRPEKKEIFNIHNPSGIRWIIQLLSCS